MRRSPSYSILTCILLWGRCCLSSAATTDEDVVNGRRLSENSSAVVVGDDGTTVDDDTNNNNKRKYHFAMASGGSVYFEPIRQGWEEKCEQLGVECEYHLENVTTFLLDFPTEEDRIETPKPCVEQMRQFIAAGVDGMAVKCNLDHEVFYQAKEAGIPVVTFSGLHPGPNDAYVGTDNYAMGRQMARLLKQLIQGRGEYTYVTAHNGDSATERHIGFVEEIEKDNNRDDKVGVDCVQAMTTC